MAAPLPVPFPPGEFVRVAGKPLEYAVETNVDPRKIDHFWITIAAGMAGPLRIALSTYSTKQARAGVNPHLRVATLATSWTQLPESGVGKAGRLDYGEIEAETPLRFAEFTSEELVKLLAERAGRAALVEAWGDLYARDHLGIHQVHCRRASPSVPTDHRGRDGAVRFYYPEPATAEMLFFKYFGQP